MKRPSPIMLVVLAALVVRILFWLFVAPRLLGGQIYQHADTESFVAPAMNLREIGTYTSDPNLHDGLFTRVPGYAFLLLLFSFLPWPLLKVVAVFQVGLDAINAGALVRLGNRTKMPLVGLLAGLIYSVYPFALLWITPTVPDVVTTFFTIVGLIFLSREKNTVARDAFLDAAFIALATLTREYLILLALPAAAIWLYRQRDSYRNILIAGVVGVVSFSCVFAPWPLRNILVHHEFIVFRAGSSGYPQYAPDTMAAIDWIATWAPDQGTYLNRIAQNQPLEGPPHIWESEEERINAEALFGRARTCGMGIRLWGSQEAPVQPCTDEIEAEFKDLKSDYIRRHPMRWAFEVPLKNLWKILFKNDLTREKASLTTRLAFAARSILLVMGLVGIIRFRRNETIVLITAWAIAVYIFMAFAMRGVQIRYLLQADVIMLIPASALIAEVLTKIRGQISSS
jgi:hypothetical protein